MRSSGPAVPSSPVPLLELQGVSKQFPVKQGVLGRVRRHVHAVSEVSLTIGKGETVGLVGESGSGKSTLGRLALRLAEPTGGTVRYEGEDVTHASRRGLREFRRHAQMVFQDPYSSFDPLLPLGVSVGEPLDVHLDLRRDERERRVAELMGLVGLGDVHLRRYPRELSGGQLQRMAIARALAVDPKLVVLDEPVSSLDVSTQAQVINLLEELRRRLGVAFLFISHNPALVHHTSDRIAVMYLGEIVEVGTAAAVYRAPKHPYTEALLSAVMVPDPDAQHARRRIVLAGDVPDPSDPPAGCRFHTRCQHVMDICRREVPAPFLAPDMTEVRCHLHTSGPMLAGRPVAGVGAVGPTRVTVPLAAPRPGEPG
jgi:oligopeptide/dipeptide ABC transporter ATP-binding protein